MQPAKVLPATDPDVKIPRAAQLAAARSNEYYKKADEPPAADPPAEPAPPQASADAPPEPAAPSADATPAPQPVPPTASAEPPPESPKEPPKEAAPTNWERAFKSMKGRYERSEQATKTLREQLAELQELVATLQQPPKKEERQQPSTDRLITKADVEDYGEDLLDVVGRKAKEDLLPLVADLRAELADIKRRLHGTDDQLKTSARQRMFDTLDAKLPRWRQLNEDQDFLNWLDLPDNYSGAIRKQLLNQAVDENSANRVLAFFNGFLAEEAASVPDTNALVTLPAPAKPAPVEKTPLEAWAAPGRAKSAAASNAPAEKPVITRDQISAFYSEVRRGLYKGREAEKEAAERMISEASREGRIR